MLEIDFFRVRFSARRQYRVETRDCSFSTKEDAFALNCGAKKIENCRPERGRDLI